MCDACKEKEDCPEEGGRVLILMGPPIILERPKKPRRIEDEVITGIGVGLLLSLPMFFPMLRFSLLGILVLLLAPLIYWAGRKKKEKMLAISTTLFHAITFVFIASSVLSITLGVRDALRKPLQPPAQTEQAPQPIPPERHH